MPINVTKIPDDKEDFEVIKNKLIASDGKDCTHPAGHCYGNDGGSGIPENLKVIEGSGGSKEVWTIDSTTKDLLTKAVYLKCQYCQKYLYVEDIKEDEEK